MLGLGAALALFLAVVAAASSRRGAVPSGDEPRRLPRPGARDLHAVSPGTLGRAPVPSWG